MYISDFVTNWLLRLCELVIETNGTKWVNYLAIV